MKQTKKKEDIVTKSYFRKELNRAITPLKNSIAAQREEMHAIEFRLDNKIDAQINELSDKMDKRFAVLEEKMDRAIDRFQTLADVVIGEHKNFEVESLSIKQNYSHLEGRVKKVEEVIFPS